MKNKVKITLFMTILVSCLNTAIDVNAYPWQCFRPQATAFAKKAFEVAKQKGAVTITLTTPFASTFTLGGYCGNKKASLKPLNKPEKIGMGLIGARLGAHNTIIAISPIKTPLKVALSCVTWSVPLGSYFLGFRLGEIATKKKLEMTAKSSTENV